MMFRFVYAMWPCGEVYPYMGLQMLDVLLQMRGFLVGTTNRIFLDRTNPQVVLEASRARVQAPELRRCPATPRPRTSRWTSLAKR